MKRTTSQEERNEQHRESLTVQQAIAQPKNAMVDALFAHCEIFAMAKTYGKKPTGEGKEIVEEFEDG